MKIFFTLFFFCFSVLSAVANATTGVHQLDFYLGEETDRQRSFESSLSISLILLYLV